MLKGIYWVNIKLHFSVNFYWSSCFTMSHESAKWISYMFTYHPVFRISSFFRSSQIIGWASQLTVVRNLPANAGDTSDAGLIPGSGIPPWSRKWQPTPVSCLENSNDRGAWRATALGVWKGRAWLSIRTHRALSFLCYTVGFPLVIYFIHIGLTKKFVQFLLLQ